MTTNERITLAAIPPASPSDSEIIEAMARAMCAADGYDPDGPEFAEVHFTWELYRDRARQQYHARLIMERMIAAKRA